MSTTSQRIGSLVIQAPALERWVGEYDGKTLLEWLDRELGHREALDGWVPHGSIFSRAVALSPVLHVVSGNTPHAAFQSVFRGLLLGALNRVKLPGAGLPEFEEWVAKLPAGLAPLVEMRRDLPAPWLDCAAAVIFGDQSTIETFRRLLPPGIPRIEHGPKWSIAAVFDPTEEAAERVAEDVLKHEQRGCLSVQAVFVEGEVIRFGHKLAAAMQRFREREGRPIPALSDSGAVFNARELARFRAANGEPLRLWESAGSTAWTVLFDPDPRLAPGPLNGFVTLHPLPEKFGAEALGPEAEFISTAALFPFSPENVEKLAPLAPPRICEAGNAQKPTLLWHHDGEQTLATLVRWRDLG